LHSRPCGERPSHSFHVEQSAVADPQAGDAPGVGLSGEPFARELKFGSQSAKVA